jgi:hypothetical protein
MNSLYLSQLSIFPILNFILLLPGYVTLIVRETEINKEENKFLLQLFMPPPMCYYYFLLTGQLSSPLLLLPAPIQSN